MGKLISVVIPTYKKPKSLLKCLKSFLLQTCNKNDFEIIVISDGPDYSIQLLVESFNKDGFTFKYNCATKKAGLATARNIGWKMASSQLIAFTNDDCLPDKDWLKNLITAHYNGDVELIAYTGKLVIPISTIPIDYEKNILKPAAATFTTANCCCTKKALEKVGGFDERFCLNWLEDSDLEFNFITNQIPIIKNKEQIVEHALLSAPWGKSIKEQKKVVYNALLYKKHPSLYRKFIRPKPVWNYYAMFLLAIGIIVGLFLKPYFSIACVFIYLIFLFNFINKRLINSSHSFIHVSEIIYTSTLIPFLFIYWQLNGALKYKVLFF